MELTKLIEANLIKEAFELAIEAKKKNILRLLQEEQLAEVIGCRIKNGKKLKTSDAYEADNSKTWIESYTRQIHYLSECHEKAEDMREKISDQRIEKYAKQFNKRVMVID